VELTLKKGIVELMGEVVNQDLCTVCGACAGLCPYLRIYRERVAMIDLCGINKGQCYEICPRTRTDLEALNRQVFGVGRDDHILGTHRKLLFGRAKDASIREAGQYGGTVTSLMQFILADHRAEAALLAARNENFPLLPEPIIAKTPDDVLKASGSKYTASPTLSMLEKALKENRSVSVVGRGCQVTALRKKQAINPEAERVAPVIGLFCMWALDYRTLESYLEPELDLAKVKKYNIPEGDFVVYTDDGTKRFPFEEIKDRRRQTCDLCYDFTGELADISVGSTELEDDWNTVIIRSELGEKLWEDALGADVVEEKPFPAERIEVLRNAARGKKERAVAGLKERFGAQGSALGYLVLSEEEAGGYK